MERCKRLFQLLSLGAGLFFSAFLAAEDEAPKPLMYVDAGELNPYAVVQLPVGVGTRYLVVETDRAVDGNKVSCEGRPVVLFTGDSEEQVRYTAVSDQQMKLSDPRAWISNDYVPSNDGVLGRGTFTMDDKSVVGPSEIKSYRLNEFQWVFRPSNGDAKRQFRWVGMQFQKGFNRACGLYVYAMNTIPKDFMVSPSPMNKGKLSLPDEHAAVSRFRARKNRPLFYGWDMKMKSGHFYVKRYDNQTSRRGIEVSVITEKDRGNRDGIRKLVILNDEDKGPATHWVNKGKAEKDGRDFDQNVSPVEKIVQGNRWVLEEMKGVFTLRRVYFCLEVRPTCIFAGRIGSPEAPKSGFRVGTEVLEEDERGEDLVGEIIDLDPEGAGFGIRHPGEEPPGKHFVRD